MKIQVQPSDWNDRLEKMMEELRPASGVENIRFFVQRKDIGVFEVIVDDVSIGFFLWRIDVLYNGEREMVVLHAVSDVKGRVPLSHMVSAFLPDLAAKYGLGSIRIHSESRGLDRLLEDAGFEFMESVFVKKVA